MKLLLWLVLAIMAPSVSPGAEGPPHLVLFLADDLGWDDCKTPNMSKLAAEGMSLSHAFVASPSCAPSRAALLTSLNCARSGAMFNHSKPEPKIKRWPAYFRDLGYETVAIGKTAHYAQVKEYGFDHASHFTYHDDTCIDAACSWLDERKSKRPLCLIVGTNWPHVPWPPAETARHPLPPHCVDTPKTRVAYAQYLAAVANADADVGKIYQKTRQILGANTLFVFTSDHGSQFPFGKWNCYDKGIRTPLMAVWEGKIKAGSTSTAMVSWIDILPTFLEAAGAKPNAGMDGSSFLPVLRGLSDHHRDFIFATHSGDGRMNEYPMRAIRTRDWKLIRNLAPHQEHHTHIDRAEPDLYWNSWLEKARTDPTAAAVVFKYFHRPAEELFYLPDDPEEQKNLAADPLHAETLKKLRQELDGWMRRQGDEGIPTENRLKPPVRR